MSPRLKKTALFFVVSGLILCAFAVTYYTTSLSKTRHFEGASILIEQGATLRSVLTDLVNKQIIDEPYTPAIYARINSLGNRIKAGEYEFTEDISIQEFLDKIVAGDGQIDIKITLIEGWTFQQMREALNGAAKLKKVTVGLSDQELMAKLGFPERHPEGQFYPDTYHYRLGDTDFSIYKKAFELMQEKVDLAWTKRHEDLLINNPYEALILASIIEKETQAIEEQHHISGVFSNRLRTGMRLQSDPTVIYGAADSYHGDITYKHLKTDTPYNTYTRHGLPPTPICLSGYGALLAAVQPQKTKALFFVAKGGGRHQFSETLAQHNAAVQRYLLSKKKSD